MVNSNSLYDIKFLEGDDTLKVTSNNASPSAVLERPDFWTLIRRRWPMWWIMSPQP